MQVETSKIEKEKRCIMRICCWKIYLNKAIDRFSNHQTADFNSDRPLIDTFFIKLYELHEGDFKQVFIFFYPIIQLLQYTINKNLTVWLTFCIYLYCYSFSSFISR